MAQSFVSENLKVVSAKEFDDLLRALGENRLSLRKPCMKDTRTTILSEIEDKIKNINGPNVIGTRG